MQEAIVGGGGANLQEIGNQLMFVNGTPVAGNRINFKGTGVSAAPGPAGSGIVDVTFLGTGGGGTGGGEDMIGFSADSKNNIKAGDKAYRTIPFDCTITGWYLDTNSAGNITIEIKEDLQTPTSITGTGTKPFLSSQTENDSSPVGWTKTSFLKGDIIIFEVEAGATINDVVFSLAITAI